MRVACILGSPRRGGSSAGLAAAFVDEVRALAGGAQVTEFFLQGLVFSGCIGCYACKTRFERCVLEDELAPVLEAVRDCDILALASPVYFGDLTGQAKCFFDRTFSFYKPQYIGVAEPSRLEPGKKAVLLLTQGSPDEGHFADIGPRYAYWLSSYGFAAVEVVRSVGHSGRAPAPLVADDLAAARRAAHRLLADVRQP